MPAYDFRCQNCGEEFTKLYKTVAAYSAATPTCPNCGADTLSRIITDIAVQSMSRDYTRMNANEMLSVLESGDSKQVDELYKQVGAPSAQQVSKTHETAQQQLDSVKKPKSTTD